MLESIKKRVFPFIIALSALSVSASAAFYSVSGLSKLFAGASLEVMIMASSLEVSKLVIASLLYQYWNQLNKILRVYLTIAAGVLILITSMGIYGFLSGAYVQTSTLAASADSQIILLESKKQSLTEQRDILTKEKEETLKNISDLRTGLTNNNQTYKDKKGNILTSSSSANRATFERQLDKAISRQEVVNVKIDTINSQIFKLETQMLEAKIANEASSELGPLKYISGLTGTSMDTIVNWLLLIIIFVFDPLAIALVIAANFAFKQISNVSSETSLEHTKEYKIYKEPEFSENILPTGENENSSSIEEITENPLFPEENLTNIEEPPSSSKEEFDEDEIISDPIEDFDDEIIPEVKSTDETFANFSAWKRRKKQKFKDVNPTTVRVKNDDDYIIEY